MTFTTAQAQLPFYEAVNTIERNNLSLPAEHARQDAEKAQLATENNLNDPEVEFSHLWGQKQIGTKWSVGVSQSFDWPGVYGARSEKVNAQSQALDYLTRQRRSDLRLEIANTLIDAVYAKQLHALYVDMLMRIDSLSSVYKRGYELGEISKLDINKLKIERIAAARQVNESALQLLDAKNKLTALNGGRECEDVLASLGDFPSFELMPLADYLTIAEAENPSMRYSAQMAQVSALDAKTMRFGNYPGFSVGYNHEYEMGDHFNGFSVSLTLPFFSNRKKVAAANAQQLAYEMETEDIAKQLQTSIHSDYKYVTTLNSEISQYREAIDDSENTRLLNLALKSGHITLIEYFLQTNYFLSARADYIDLLYRRALTMARLNRWNSDVMAY